MRAAIYSPYLDTAGGGEKYMMTIAEMLSSNNKVDVLLDSHLLALGADDLKKRIEKLHDLDLSKVDFIVAPVGSNDKFLDRFLFLKKYDWFFSNTDGSIPFASAKNNILHFQVPFENTDARGAWGKVRQSSWKVAICNSQFTKNIVQKTFSIKCEVVYPPVAIDDFRVLEKKKQIVTVGRFRKEKKQKVLIKAFKKMVQSSKLTGWSLHIAGGVFVGDKQLILEMKEMAKGYKIYFYENLAIKELVKLYGESSIYWHSAGFGEADPKLFEHFGITTVEAMASGCVPVVIKKGGQTEIVEEEKSGFLWEDISELVEKTLKLINNQDQMKEISETARKRSKDFSKEVFRGKIKDIITGKKKA